MQVQRLVTNDNGTRPDHVLNSQLTSAAIDSLRSAQGHLQLGHTRQGLGALHHVVGKEKLLAAELAAEAQPIQVGGVLMQQRMQLGARQGNGAAFRLGPVFHLGEWIGRQRDT
nr:hypothetical protein [Pseudoduganella violaceinigra]